MFINRKHVLKCFQSNDNHIERIIYIKTIVQMSIFLMYETYYLPCRSRASN